MSNRMTADPAVIQDPCEVARQAGYEDGYDDGRTSVRENLHRELVTTAEVAAITGLSTEALRVLRALDGGPLHFKIAGQILYVRSEVDVWLRTPETMECILDAVQDRFAGIMRALREIQREQCVRLGLPTDPATP